MKLRTLLTATALATTLALTPAVAQAQTRERAPERDAARLDRVKTRCLAQIDRRQRAIVELNARLDSRNSLTDAHRAALKQINDDVAARLTALANTIQGEDNAEELRAECRQMVGDFRVFVLLRPRARLVIVGDRELAAVAKLRDVADRIAAKHPDADLAAMRAAIDSAAQHAGAIYEEVIHLTAADGDRGALAAGREDAHAARDAIRDAVKAGHEAVRALRSEA